MALCCGSNDGGACIADTLSQELEEVNIHGERLEYPRIARGQEFLNLLSSVPTPQTKENTQLSGGVPPVLLCVNVEMR